MLQLVGRCVALCSSLGGKDIRGGEYRPAAERPNARLVKCGVDALRPPFRLSKLEGDAAFGYLASSDLDGSLLQDIVEATYFTFRRRLRDIKQASVCECDACRHARQQAGFSARAG